MLLIEKPTEISIQIDGNNIKGMVHGTIEDWTFTSSHTYFTGIVGANTLKKVDLHKSTYNLNEIDNKISAEIRKILN